jgi:hypothetical protein
LSWFCGSIGIVEFEKNLLYNSEGLRKFRIIWSNQSAFSWFFIFLFAEILGHKWLFGLMGIFGKGFLAPLGNGEHGLELFTSVSTLVAI